MGWMLLAFTALIVPMSLVSIMRYPPPPHFGLGFVCFTFILIAFAAVGIGLIHLKKWAAIAFSVMTLSVAYRAGVASIHTVPWSWEGVGYWYAALFAVPSILTLKYWRFLNWHGGTPT